MTQQYEAPVGEVESVIAQSWKELLQVERVGGMIPLVTFERSCGPSLTIVATAADYAELHA